MKKQLTTDYLELVAQIEHLSAYHYRIWITLLTGAYTQAQLAAKLNIKRQNINRCVKDLSAYGLITVDRIEGRNKFIKAITSSKALQNTLNNIDKGQMHFD